MEMEQRRAVRFLVDDRGRDVRAEIDPVADPRAPGIAQKGLPLAGANALVQRRANRCVSTPAFKLGGDHLGVVKHQDIAGPQDFRQIEHLAVGNAGPVDQQQPARIARPRRPQRDAVMGKLEIEQVDAHGSAL